METIESVTAYYPAFELGCHPLPIECQLRIVEANGKRFVKTPFAMLDASERETLDWQFEGSKYFRTAEECQQYLDRQYPRWQLAQPIMDAWFTARYHYGPLGGNGRICDKLQISPLTDELSQLARGSRMQTEKQIKRALKQLA